LVQAIYRGIAFLIYTKDAECSQYTKVEHEVIDVMILDMNVPDGVPDRIVLLSPVIAVVKVIRNMVVDVRHDRMGPFITSVLKAIAGKMVGFAKLTSTNIDR
jgi:hypothetical protein